MATEKTLLDKFVYKRVQLLLPNFRDKIKYTGKIVKQKAIQKIIYTANMPQTAKKNELRTGGQQTVRNEIHVAHTAHISFR